MGFSIGRALGGAGQAMGDIANKYIDQDLAMQRQQAFLDMQRLSNQQSMADKDAFENDPARRARNATLNAQDITIQGRAKGAVDLESAVNAASNEDLTKALAARAGAEASAKSANTDRDVSPGQQVVRNGQMVYENKRQTPAEVNADLYKEGLKQSGGGSKKADHFDDKAWNDVKKIDSALVTFVDPATGGKVESPELRTVYLGQLNQLQAKGDLTPNEASEQARTATLKLKNKASEMVDAAREKDPKTKLTEQAAVQQILKAFSDAQRAQSNPKPAPVAAPAPVAPVAPANAGVPLAQRAAQSAGPSDPAMAQVPSIQLSGIAQSPRSSPAARAAAQAELDRRAQQQPQANVDPMYDPANYAR